MKDWVPPQVNIADMPSERKDDERKQHLATSRLFSILCSICILVVISNRAK